MSAITTHVLDTARGQPAQGVPLILELASSDGSWKVMGKGTTDADGRCQQLLAAGASLAAGTYRLRFDTQSYFASLGVQGFYPYVTVVFTVRETTQHYHVPLLLNPFGYSTYRGS